MTNAQKWMAAFLGLFLILLIIGKVTKKDDGTEAMSMQMMQQSQQAAQETDGLSLMRQTGCVTCHGSNLQGTKMAPALAGLKEYWSRDKLINYLRNPNSFMDSDRFKGYRAKYPNGIMPSYGNKDVKDLGKIADYLLAQ